MSATRRLMVIAICAAVLTACARTLPEEDRRILDATAVAKMSTDDLSKDYEQNAADADAKYWGKAIEVAGQITRIVKERTPPQLLFGPAPDGHVRASLLGDQAPQLLENAAEGQRIRLKCYCAGRDGAQIILKSCVKP